MTPDRTAAESGPAGPATGGSVRSALRHAVATLRAAVHEATSYRGHCARVYASAAAAAAAVEAFERLGGDADADGNALYRKIAQATIGAVYLAESRVLVYGRSTKLQKEPSFQGWEVKMDELTLGRVLGQGSFGRVHAAIWQGTDVAAKVLHAEGSPADTAALCREAGLLMRARHPNVCLFMGLSTSPPCVVTELCPRGSLFDVLRKHGRAGQASLDWLRRLTVAHGAALGMQHLHARRIWHRDLRSPNLLLDAHWRPKARSQAVADFDMGRVMLASVATATGTMHNPAWAAPEVLQGRPYCAAADVFSFGVILWEILTLREPWAGTDVFRVMQAVVDGDRLIVPEPDEADPAFAGRAEYVGLLQACWGDEPSRPKFGEVASALRAMLEAVRARENASQRQRVSGVHAAMPAEGTPQRE